MREMPAISSTSYFSTPVNMMAALGAGVVNVPAQHQFAAGVEPDWIRQALALHGSSPTTTVKPQEQEQMATNTRLVQVFIADPNDNIPLDKRLLYSGEQKITDLTDQELFFEIDVKSALDAHNKLRSATVNKAVKERTENLEPARIRDLKMTVVTIAQF